MACKSTSYGCSQLPLQFTQPAASPSTSSSPVNEHPRVNADRCCDVASEFTCTSVNTCDDGCCDGRTGTLPEQDNRPSCCKGRSSPCCDPSCIDRIALRYCINEKDSTKSPSECNGRKADKSCRYHTRRAKKRFQSKLEILGCICRALLSLGEDPCCLTFRPLLFPDKRSPTRASVAACGPVRRRCAPQAPEAAAPAKAACTDPCCSNEKITTCAGDENRPCADACCGEKMNADRNVLDNRPHPMHIGHVEAGLAGKEHVILTVSGMTCTGCETKLTRTLSPLPSLTNLRTSLVLSRVEFDLDTGAQSVAEVMRHLERTTEFKCERLSSQGSTIDLICDGNSAEFIKKDWPEGVTEVKAVDKQTIRVNFDAKIIGARDLLKNGWSTPMKLAPPCVDPNLDSGARHVWHVGYMTLLSVLLTIPVLILAWAPLPHKEQKAILFGSISLAFATVIQFVVAGPFYTKALKALVFSRVIEMDLLVVLSTSAAYVFSVAAFGYVACRKPLSTGEFFETSTLLVTLIMVGRFITALARQKAVESISIRSLQTPTATLVHEGDNRMEEDIDARLLQYGDVFRVSPDSRVPTDGIVISGASDVDESMLTGESRPVEKLKGSTLIAGSINGASTLTVRLTRIPGDNTISAVASMVDEAKLSKPRLQKIADQAAGYFVPVIIAITVMVFCIWIGLGISVQNKSGSEAVIEAVTYAITVLIVSCPCAIGLAVPMISVIAAGIAAEKGVIFKSVDAIETAWKTTHVVFDKTGTLTQGKLRVIRTDYPNPSPNTKALLLGLIRSSKHPVSVSVAIHLKAEGVMETPILEARNVVGKGVEGTFAGHTLRAGSASWLGLSDNPLVLSSLSQGYSAFCFAVDDEIAAVFGLQDSLREDAFDALSRLQQGGITVHVLSGDDDSAVRSVTTQLGVPDSNVRSRCSPADKQAYIKELQDIPNPRGTMRKTTRAVVVFCGDGTNDAIALAQASIGVHMNEGTDVARSAADVVLVRPNLGGIMVAIEISKRSIHRIWFNFGWSFLYNVFAILLSAGALVHLRLPPAFAGLGELVSVLPVVAAGMLLKWRKI